MARTAGDLAACKMVAAASRSLGAGGGREEGCGQILKMILACGPSRQWQEKGRDGAIWSFRVMDPTWKHEMERHVR